MNWKKTSWSLNISLSQLHKSNNLNLRWRNSNNFLSILVFSGQNPLGTNVLPGSFPEEVEVANLLRTCYGETGVMGSSSMKSYSREWTPESAVGLVTGHWWQTWLMMSITSVILPAEIHHYWTTRISSTRPVHLSLNKLVISAVSSAQVVPRLTYRQRGSVATSPDALSPLWRLLAKPEPEWILAFNGGGKPTIPPFSLGSDNSYKLFWCNMQWIASSVMSRFRCYRTSKFTYEINLQKVHTPCVYTILTAYVGESVIILFSFCLPDPRK